MTSNPECPQKIVKPIKDYFIIQFDGGIYILSNDYKDEIRTFLSDRTTSLTYLNKRHTIDEIAEFLKTEEHCKSIMERARSSFQ